MCTRYMLYCAGTWYRGLAFRKWFALRCCCRLYVCRLIGIWRVFSLLVQAHTQLVLLPLLDKVTSRLMLVYRSKQRCCNGMLHKK